MSVVTPISGNIYPNNSPLHSLKSTLGLIGISVTHPARNESLFYETDAHAAWRMYDNEFLFYKSIASSSFHIVYSDEPITNQVALQIIYAMSKNRPILMTGKLTFASTTIPFMRETITKHAQHFHRVKLAELELTELSILLSKLKPIDYSLSRNEKVLIKAGVKMHFRHLIERAKTFRTKKSKK
jgi:hypothetical protein